MEEVPPREPPALLESHAEYRKRWRSLYVIFFTTFLMAFGFSIVLTGVWPYLDKVIGNIVITSINLNLSISLSASPPSSWTRRPARSLWAG